MGQRQHGVDIRGQLPGGGIAGVQCKRKRQWPVSELTTNDIDDEVSEALSFEPSLSKFEALAHKFDHAIEAECQQHKAPRGHAGPNRNNSFDGHPGDGEPFQPEGLTRIRASRSSRGGRTNGGGAQHSVIRKIYPTLGGGSASDLLECASPRTTVLCRASMNLPRHTMTVVDAPSIVDSAVNGCRSLLRSLFREAESAPISRQPKVRSDKNRSRSAGARSAHIFSGRYPTLW